MQPPAHGFLPGIREIVPNVRGSMRQAHAPFAGTTGGHTMSGDTLSDLLRAVRLRGAVFFYLTNSDPWVAETPQSSKIIPAVLPGTDHLIPFHGLAKGSCWAAVVGQEPVRLDEGDIVLFPRGDHHVLSSTPGMRAKHVEDRKSV